MSFKIPVSLFLLMLPEEPSAQKKVTQKGSLDFRLWQGQELRQMERDSEISESDLPTEAVKQVTMN